MYSTAYSMNQQAFNTYNSVIPVTDDYHMQSMYAPLYNVTYPTRGTMGQSVNNTMGQQSTVNNMGHNNMGHSNMDHNNMGHSTNMGHINNMCHNNVARNNYMRPNHESLVMCTPTTKGAPSLGYNHDKYGLNDTQVRSHDTDDAMITDEDKYH